MRLQKSNLMMTRFSANTTTVITSNFRRARNTRTRHVNNVFQQVGTRPGIKLYPRIVSFIKLRLFRGTTRDNTVHRITVIGGGAHHYTVKVFMRVVSTVNVGDEDATGGTVCLVTFFWGGLTWVEAILANGSYGRHFFKYEREARVEVGGAG